MRNCSAIPAIDRAEEAGVIITMKDTARKKILLVDDEIIIAMVESDVMKHQGYEVITACSGKEAIDLVKADASIDLVLMDIDLGRGIDGTETARKILAFKNLPIVFLTSHSEREMVERVRGITRYGYVLKNSGNFVLQSSIEMAFELFDAHVRTKKHEKTVGEHQVELEMQAEELQRIHQDLERSHEKYLDLYDLSPVGYFTISGKGLITKANLTAAAILGMERTDLTGRALLGFVAKDDESVYYTHLRKLVNTEIPQLCEIRMNQKIGSLLWVSFHAVVAHRAQDRNPSYLVAISNITERKQAEEKIASLLVEKELLLKEVHHRIKNNMNTMMSLLSLQSRTLKDPLTTGALRDAMSRFKSMEVLYDKLYRSEGFREISIRDYLPPLIDEIIDIFPNKGIVTIETKMADFPLSERVVSPLGIIVNELTTNAMKYAFTGRDRGMITVSASLNYNRATLVFEDNGNGIPESIDIETSAGFGLQLITLLTEQLEGTIRLERQAGTKFILEFEV